MNLSPDDETSWHHTEEDLAQPTDDTISTNFSSDDGCTVLNPAPEISIDDSGTSGFTFTDDASNSLSGVPDVTSQTSNFHELVESEPISFRAPQDFPTSGYDDASVPSGTDLAVTQHDPQINGSQHDMIDSDHYTTILTEPFPAKELLPNAHTELQTETTVIQLDVHVDVPAQQAPVPTNYAEHNVEPVAYPVPTHTLDSPQPANFVPHEYIAPIVPTHFPTPPKHEGDSIFSSVKEWIENFIHAVEDSFHVFLLDLHNGQVHLPRFDPGGWIPSQHGNWSSHDNEHVIGAPEKDMSYWEMQTSPDTCAVVSQKFIIEELTGRHIEQHDIVQVAEEHNLYHRGQGTTTADIGELLEVYGLHTHSERGASIHDLKDSLAEGHKILVAVNGQMIWESGTPHGEELQLENVFGLPGGGANHCVQVIGIDENHAGGPMVILNDPGTPDGQGLMVPLHDFEQSWSTSGNLMVNTVETAA